MEQDGSHTIATGIEQPVVLPGGAQVLEAVRRGVWAILRPLSHGAPIIEIDKNPFILGRAESGNTDYCLRMEFVSGRHCAFYREGSSMYVRDLGSTNGTYVVNSDALEVVRPQEPALLQNECSVSVARLYVWRFCPLSGPPGYTTIAGGTLGHGAFGVTFEVVKNDTGVVYACKSVKKNRLIGDKHKRWIQREKTISLNFSHPNIVKVEDVIDESDVIYFIMELVRGGRSLVDRVIPINGFPEAEAKRLFLQLAGAVQYLHTQMGVCHRDLKPDNVLCSYVGDGSLQLKLADFGFVRLVESTEGPPTAFVGTRGYQAPEVLQLGTLKNTSAMNGRQTDCWSLGVILYNMLTGCPLIDYDKLEDRVYLTKVYRKICKANGEFPNGWPIEKSSNAKDLVKRLLEFNPKKRMAIDDVFRHVWICTDEMAIDMVEPSQIIQPVAPASRVRFSTEADVIGSQALPVQIPVLSPMQQQQQEHAHSMPIHVPGRLSNDGSGSRFSGSSGSIGSPSLPNSLCGFDTGLSEGVHGDTTGEFESMMDS